MGESSRCVHQESLLGPPHVQLPSSLFGKRDADCLYLNVPGIELWKFSEPGAHGKSVDVTEFWRQGPDHWESRGISTSPPFRTQWYVGTADAVSRQEVSGM